MAFYSFILIFHELFLSGWKVGMGDDELVSIAGVEDSAGVVEVSD
jgi:hypothetical protein